MYLKYIATRLWCKSACVVEKTRPCGFPFSSSHGDIVPVFSRQLAWGRVAFISFLTIPLVRFFLRGGVETRRRPWPWNSVQRRVWSAATIAPAMRRSNHPAMETRAHRGLSPRSMPRHSRAFRTSCAGCRSPRFHAQAPRIGHRARRVRRGGARFWALAARRSEADALLRVVCSREIEVFEPGCFSRRYFVSLGANFG